MRLFGSRLPSRFPFWPTAIVVVCGFAVSATLSGCSTDVEVNAPYQTRAVVFGLLDPADTVQLVRIQKSFLNLQEPDAFKAARVKDSIYFAPGENMNVQLIREEANGQQVILGNMERVEVTGKDSGVFHYPDQVVYRFRGKLIPEDSLQLRRLYSNNPSFLSRRRIRMVITNSNGYQAIARTKLVYPLYDDDNNNLPADGYRLIAPARAFGTRTFVTVSPNIQMAPNLNGAVFKIILTVPYEEVSRNNTRDTFELGWTFMSEYYATGNERQVGNQLSDPSRRYEFYELLRQSVDTTKDVAYRKLLPIRIRTIAADSGLSSYLQVSGSFSAITQTKPFFTNVSNGLGLLASRTEKTFLARIDTSANGEPARVFNNISRYRSMRFRFP